ncbi:MAG: peptidase M1, partial [Cytophagales bacterium]|nr:peptidase M1 [Cytophagales bacterium]
FRNYKNNDVTLAVAAYYANTAPADQFDWFTGQFRRTDASFLYTFTQLFGDYLGKQPAETQQRGVPFLEKIAQNAKSEYVRYSAYQTLGLFEDLPGVKEIRSRIRAQETHPTLKSLYESE